AIRPGQYPHPVGHEGFGVRLEQRHHRASRGRLLAVAEGPINAGYIHMSVPHAAGALYSTTEDLLRWEQGLFSGTVVSSASLQKMTTPFKNDYALGVMVQTVQERKVVSHGGGIEGFNTFLAYYPEDKLTVAVLANIRNLGVGIV